MKLIGSRQAWLCASVPVFALLAVAAAYAGQESTQPDGFGKAKFGMNEEQVRKLYPKAKETILPMATPAPGQVAFPLAMTDYDLADQSIGSFHKCTVRLRLFDHALTQVHFTCSKKDKVKDYLVKRFGPPSSSSDRALSWTGGKAAVTLSLVSGTFMFADAARDQAASKAILLAIMQAQQQAARTTTPEAPTPSPGAAQ